MALKILNKLLSFKVFHKSSLEYLLNRSRFLLIVPENNIGSWEIIDIFDLKPNKDIYLVSMLPMHTILSKSTNQGKMLIYDDFPALVLRTIIVLSPFLIL